MLATGGPGGGMFGLNENDSQVLNSAGSNSAGHPSDQPNPFSGDDGPVVEPGSPTQQVTPSAPVITPEPHPTPHIVSSGSSAPAGDDDLMDLKQQALQNLQPLVSHLEQSPEEKFKTTMMLIQATDNSSLVKQAYEAANQIPDEKARAQALLDVVNEINYFTHKEDK
jgi:hypothetical protein